MAEVNIQIKNVKKFQSAFNTAPKELASGLQKTIVKVGGFTMGEVKRNITSGIGMWKSPIDTGAMRRGIHVGSSGKLSTTIRPSSSTPYANYVHDGTSKMKARPFFSITANVSKKKIGLFVQEALKNMVNDIVKKTR